MAPNLLGSTHGLLLGTEEQPTHTIGNKNSQALSVKKKQFTKSQAQSDRSITGASFGEKKNSDKKDNKLEIVWKNVAIFFVIHLIWLNCIYILVTLRLQLVTFIFAYMYGMFGGFGITAGAHRLWAHRAYKANLPLRIFLMLAQSAATQNKIYIWVRDHRVHHKFTDTNADPHNVKRGFFFSHMGWLLCRKHKDVLEKGKTVDISDVLADPVVQFQIRYYIPLIILMNTIVPSVIPWYFWGEDGWTSIVMSFGRYVFSLHGTWLVNSAAHIWGMKPYDQTIKSTENKFVAIAAYGEGWHNYHHVFPWDYKAAELGDYTYNFTTCFLDVMAKIGWATEMKTASEDMISKRRLRTGAGSGPDVGNLQNSYKNQNLHDHHHDGEMIWGWGDKDMDKEEAGEIKIANRIKA